MYALVKNNQVVEYPIINLYQRFSNISFPANIDHSKLPEGIVWVSTANPPSYNQKTHKIVLGEQPVLQNNIWQQVYSVASLNIEEIAQNYDVLARQIRDQRNQLLAESDWTQIPDAPVNKAAWAGYRQLLRDVTKQAGFPYEIAWPIKPE